MKWWPWLLCNARREMDSLAAGGRGRERGEHRRAGWPAVMQGCNWTTRPAERVKPIWCIVFSEGQARIRMAAFGSSFAVQPGDAGEAGHFILPIATSLCCRRRLPHGVRIWVVFLPVLPVSPPRPVRPASRASRLPSSAATVPFDAGQGRRRPRRRPLGQWQPYPLKPRPAAAPSPSRWLCACQSPHSCTHSCAHSRSASHPPGPSCVTSRAPLALLQHGWPCTAVIPIHRPPCPAAFGNRPSLRGRPECDTLQHHRHCRRQ